MEISQLMHRLTEGDHSAARALIAMQRQGHAMRLYPHGRRGPLDEGVAPFLAEITDEHLVCWTVPRPMTIAFRKHQVGMVASQLIAAIVRMDEQVRVGDTSIPDLESRITPQMGFRTWVPDDPPLAIAIALEPVERTSWQFALYHACKIIDAWVTIIESNDWDYGDFGFTDELYRTAVAVADSGDNDGGGN